MIGIKIPDFCQCDQIGRFMKVLGNRFACKSSPTSMVTFWAILKSLTLCKKNCCAIYLGNFWKHLGYIFTPLSVRTGSLPVTLNNGKASRIFGTPLINPGQRRVEELLRGFDVLNPCSKFFGNLLIHWCKDSSRGQISKILKNTLNFKIAFLLFQLKMERPKFSRFLPNKFLYTDCRN